MRTKSLLCRLRLLHTMGLHASHPGLLAQSNGTNFFCPTGHTGGRAIRSPGSSRGLPAGTRFPGLMDFPNAGTTTLLAKTSNLMCSLNPVRAMGIGSFKEGSRSGQHGARLPHATPDGSPQKAEQHFKNNKGALYGAQPTFHEALNGTACGRTLYAKQDRRREFLDNAKKESSAHIDKAQAPFQDSLESTQSIGEATTELQFGVQDGKSAEEAIENASHELFRQSTVNASYELEEPIKAEDKRTYPADEENKFTLKDHPADNPLAEVSSEVWSGKEHDGTSAFLDDSDKVEVHEESLLGVGGRRASKSLTDEVDGPGERAWENIEKTQDEVSQGKARSSQAGVIVGNVPATGANALDTES